MHLTYALIPSLARRPVQVLLVCAATLLAGCQTAQPDNADPLAALKATLGPDDHIMIQLDQVASLLPTKTPYARQVNEKDFGKPDLGVARVYDGASFYATVYLFQLPGVAPAGIRDDAFRHVLQEEHLGLTTVEITRQGRHISGPWAHVGRSVLPQGAGIVLHEYVEDKPGATPGHLALTTYDGGRFAKVRTTAKPGAHAAYHRDVQAFISLVLMALPNWGETAWLAPGIDLAG